MSKKKDDKEEPSYESIFRKGHNWETLWVFQKANTLYQMTFVFCDRFLPLHGDRTRDQMVQAARSGKQNIVEGSEDGKTSSEMEVNLLNVARSSIGELRQDYGDYLVSRRLEVWDKDAPRFNKLREFTRKHNKLEEYEPYFQKWTGEEMANVGLTLCHQIDAMMNKYLGWVEQEFVTEGGVKERMYKARTGYREQQDKLLARLQEENRQLKQQLEESKAEISGWKTKYEDLKQRALKAYNDQQGQIKELQHRLGEG